MDEALQSTILIVDDNPTNLGLIFDYLSRFGYRIVAARDGESGLRRARLVRPDLILLDVMMPGLGGFEVSRQLKADPATCDIPIIFLTSLASLEDKVHGFQAGAVDYVTKPIQQEELLARVNAHLHIRHLTRNLQTQNERLQQLTHDLSQAHGEVQKLNEHLEYIVTERTEELRGANARLVEAYDAILEGWSLALELRDTETVGHSRRVTKLAERLARALGFDGQYLVDVRRGALLHDIGKMGIPDAILHKPAALTPAEMNIMRQHPVYAYEMLAPIEYLRTAIDIPYGHHERWDGAGYPRGIQGEEIPLPARLFAVIDVWDALLSDRPYRRAWTRQQAEAYIRDNSGTHFDPQVVGVFMGLVVDDRFNLDE